MSCAITDYIKCWHILKNKLLKYLLFHSPIIWEGDHNKTPFLCICKGMGRYANKLGLCINHRPSSPQLQGTCVVCFHCEIYHIVNPGSNSPHTSLISAANTWIDMDALCEIHPILNLTKLPIKHQGCTYLIHFL